ncbi:three-helix bundle dimerization domain-containing protein [Streptomyces agglomeratus]|uniref:three-helix bundle dimerization domain-containing protein n=1 Tax=Streptomyces agglomeratus TaxID=285458 RepID=UPI0034E3D92D
MRAVKLRLHQRFDNSLGVNAVDRARETARRRFDASPIRLFIPIPVERQATGTPRNPALYGHDDAGKLTDGDHDIGPPLPERPQGTRAPRGRATTWFGPSAHPQPGPAGPLHSAPYRSEHR